MNRKKHNKTWFKNRLGKTIYCDDHNEDERCHGIILESEEITVKNLLKSQEEGVRFFG